MSIKSDIEKLLDPDWDHFKPAVARLRAAGDAALAPLTLALKNPDYYRKHNGVHCMQPSPLESILEILADNASKSSIEPIASLLNNDDERIRKEAALALGEIGRVEGIPAIRRALKDLDDYVKSYAVMGIGRGTKRPHCTEAFRNELFNDVVILLDVSDYNAATQAPRTLLMLDRDKASVILLSVLYD